MKRFSFLFLALVATMIAKAQAPATWSLDKGHANIGFAVTHMGLSEIYGTFGKFDATFTGAKDDFSDAVIDMTAEATSINTGHEGRDKDLGGDKFFDFAKYPKFSFKSTSVAKVNGNQYKVMGDLTLKGVTKPISLTMTINGPVDNPWNKKKNIGIIVRGSIKRNDFGIGAGMPAQMLSDDIQINASAEFLKG